jgi:hypothetical protein
MGRKKKEEAFASSFSKKNPVWDYWATCVVSTAAAVESAGAGVGAGCSAFFAQPLTASARTDMQNIITMNLFTIFHLLRVLLLYVILKSVLLKTSYKYIKKSTQVKKIFTFF